MIKHVWSVLCIRSVIDSDSNNISLMDVLEQIEVQVEDKKRIKKEIIVPINYELVNFWAKTKANERVTMTTTVEIIDPSGKKTKTMTKDLVIPAGKLRMRERIKIQGFVFTDPGTHYFRIKYATTKDKRNKQVAEIPFVVKLIVNNKSQRPVA